MRGRAWREIPDPLAGVESLGEGRAHVDGRRDLFAEYLVAEQLARDRGSPVDSVGDDDATRLVAAAQLPRLVDEFDEAGGRMEINPARIDRN